MNGQFYEGWKNRYPVDSTIRPSYNRPLGSVVRRPNKISTFVKLAVDRYNLRLRFCIYKFKFLRSVVGSRCVVSQLFGLFFTALRLALFAIRWIAYPGFVQQALNNEFISLLGENVSYFSFVLVCNKCLAIKLGQFGVPFSADHVGICGDLSTNWLNTVTRAFICSN